MINGDILELTPFQTLFEAVPVRNVLGYEVMSVGSLDEAGLVLAFTQEVLPAILEIQSDALIYSRIEVVNLTDGIGFSDTDLVPDQPGEIAGSDAPPFQVYAFRKLRTNRSTRTGHVRLGGVPKAASDDGILTPTFETIVENCANALSATIGDSLSGTFRPVIIGKNADNTVRATQPVASFEYASISTQNTRKYGSGI